MKGLLLKEDVDVANENNLVTYESFFSGWCANKTKFKIFNKYFIQISEEFVQQSYNATGTG